MRHAFTKRRTKLVGTATAAAMIAASAWAVLLPAAHSAPSKPRKPDTARGHAAIAAVSAYSALSRPANSGDAVVAHSPLVALIAAHHPELGLRAADARLVSLKNPPSSLAGSTVAVVPSSSWPCLYTRSSAGSEGLSCGADAGPTESIGYDGAIGVAPDGVQSVTVTLTDGTTEKRAVANNIWSAPPEASGVSFSIGATAEHIPLMPHSSMPAAASKMKDSVLGTPGS